MWFSQGPFYILVIKPSEKHRLPIAHEMRVFVWVQAAAGLPDVCSVAGEHPSWGPGARHRRRTRADAVWRTGQNSEDSRCASGPVCVCEAWQSGLRAEPRASRSHLGDACAWGPRGLSNVRSRPAHARPQEQHLAGTVITAICPLCHCCLTKQGHMYLITACSKK